MVLVPIFATETPPRHHDVTVPVDVRLVTFGRPGASLCISIGDVRTAVRSYCQKYRISLLVYILGAGLQDRFYYLSVCTIIVCNC